MIEQVFQLIVNMYSFGNNFVFEVFRFSDH
jgi:hypothetical protein